MESYRAWKVRVYDVIFGELNFLDSHNIQLSELYRKTNLGELAVNTNSPIFSVVKLWIVSRNFMLHVFIRLQHVVQNICSFCVNLIFYLFISDV